MRKLTSFLSKLAVGAGVWLSSQSVVPAEEITKLPQTVVVVTKADEAKKEDKPKADAVVVEECPSIWANVPPVRIIPRPGNFVIPPKGSGYYSLLDSLTDNVRQGPPKYPYPPFAIMPPSFYDADFRYLDSPTNTEHDIFDPLKRIHLGDNLLFSTGGQLWWRHMHEVNSRLSGPTNDYDLFRTRVYGDLWYKDSIRAYVEFITAQSFNQNLPPAIIDRDFSDLLNAFIDVKLFDLNDKPAYLRVGRQEMLLGSQRLISALDWANTRRTFNGVRAFRQGEKLDFDLFWLQPVIPNATKFDSVDNNQNFAGAWTTYRPEKGHFIDAYYLFLDNVNNVTQQKLKIAPYNVHTIGTRYAGDRNNFLWDAEGMLQFGDRGSQSIFAGAATVGAGYHRDDWLWNPTFWAYYDFASGDQNPGTGDNYETFHQLFPFGHYYFGFLDLVGRQNIHDVNFHMYLYPTKWITFNAQLHHFELASAKDALYNAGGAAIRRDPTGKAGRDVGNELDLLVNFHLGLHSDVLVGYSKLFAGEFIKNSAGAHASPELFYMSYNFRW